MADEQGIGALTMAGLAERLGVTGMALYRHVANKADLLDGVVELLLAEFSLPPPEIPWQERLASLAANIRLSARRHPDVFPLLLQRPATTVEARRARDAVCVALVEAGVPGDRATQLERLVSTAILGFVISEVAGRFRNHARKQLDDDFEMLQSLLARLVHEAGQDR
jgi:AcrR family transcriptional regulator